MWLFACATVHETHFRIKMLYWHFFERCLPNSNLLQQVNTKMFLILAILCTKLWTSRIGGRNFHWIYLELGILNIRCRHHINFFDWIWLIKDCGTVQWLVKIHTRIILVLVKPDLDRFWTIFMPQTVLYTIQSPWGQNYRNTAHFAHDFGRTWLFRNFF